MTKWLAMIVLVFGAGVRSAESPWPEDPEGRKLFAEAQARIDAWHADSRGAVTNVIRVVYFHGADQEPLADWEERSQRILADASAFYQEGFARFGGSQPGLPFERKGDRYVIHRVTGKKKAEAYTHQSGNETYREMGEALQGTFDVRREHVLALHGLCQKEKDGKFVFHAPYYGRGSHRNGICHAADCELLDPENLDKTDEKVVYAEHYYARKEQKVSLFNTWYLGGIAHELGHGLGLPHDAGRPWEQTWSRTSLMGRGNHHYRSDRWGGKTPSFLSLASALWLASNPVMTRSDRGRWERAQGQWAEVAIAAGEQGEVKVSGRVQATIPAYAVIGYLWRPREWPGNPGGDHDSMSIPVLVGDDGAFTFAAQQLRPGDYRLRIVAVHLNGESTREDHHLKMDRSGKATSEKMTRRRR